MKKIIVFLLLCGALLLSGCGLLRREYSRTEPHSATYYEGDRRDVLRAESYQDLVNDLLLLVAAGFSTGNVIRMSVLSREEEISIMRLVGATESFIRTPMLVEGGVLGLAASLVTLLALFGIWWPLHRGLGGISPLLAELARMGFFSLKSMFLLGLLGTVTGALGALWGFWTTQRAQRKAEELAEGIPL